MTRRFEGRTAIVTGGASGAGKAVAARLIAEGAKVAIWDRDPEAATAAAGEIGAHFTRAVDVADYGAVEAAAKATQSMLGGADLLVCSAGITGATAPVVDYPLDSWRSVLDINLSGVFHACRAVAPFMVANGYGRIVNVASVAGKDPNPNAAAYAASKGGVIAFTRSMARELATKGVLVNAITPAVFETPLLKQMPQSQIDLMTAKIPMGRPGQIAEIAAMICWMLSEECSFSTGAVFDASGGRADY
ncbi:MAG: SDR family NAD(P)-dependent oxidoreductase [Terricaulis sp.]